MRPNPSLKRDPARQAAWASWRAGLCCTTPPKRLTARVALSSNVRPHTAGLSSRSTSVFQEARRGEGHASASVRVGTRPAEVPCAAKRPQPFQQRRSRTASFMCALRGIRPLFSSGSRQPVCRLAAKRRSLPFTPLVRGGEEHPSPSQLRSALAAAKGPWLQLRSVRRAA
jgi:hypothetical protein